MRRRLYGTPSIAAILSIALAGCGAAPPVPARGPTPTLSIRERMASMNAVRLARLEQLLPRVMRAAGVDMWIIASNEDRYDPVFLTMVPADAWYPITQILVLYDRGPERGIERLSLSRTDMGAFHENAWDARAWDEEKGESQWDRLRRVVRERDPVRIAVNEAEVQWAVDGLTRTMRRRLEESIGQPYAARLESAEPVATLWLETMIDEEIELYESVVATARDLIAATFASDELQPGTTTLEDLRYIYWQIAADRGVESATPPHFCLRRHPEAWERHGRDDGVIRRGDLIHSDLVTRYLGYYSDHQEWAYVLDAGETAAPEHYARILAAGNRLQDIFVAVLEEGEGKTGNQLLGEMRARAREAGIVEPRIYSHSIGLFLHEPGPLIGLPWEQEDTGPRGEVPLVRDSSFAAELSVRYPVEEWGGEQCVMGLEQQVVYTASGVRFLDGRQTAFHLVR